jgi:hypothetical protein
MKDQRVSYLRATLDGLVESLEATLRIARWEGPDGVPEPLRLSAAQLVDRLGTANRLAADRYTGSPKVVEALSTMSSAIQRLDAAFVVYRRGTAGTDAQREEGSLALDAEIDRVRAAAREEE